MKFKTVREGTQVLIRNHLGEGRIVVGPQRVFLFRESLEVLRHYTATPQEYLEIKWQDGRVEHRAGPISMFVNPLEHEYITSMKGTKLNANQALVVYKSSSEKEQTCVERRIVYGPAVFIPTADEWLHEFKWHGADMKVNKTVMIPEQNLFTKLNIVPQHFYFNVREVRTSDDTQIVVKLMIFYELNDIEKMLELTHDPIADFINAVCADVVAFATKLSYEEFQQQASKLNSQNSYPQLMQRAARIGYTVNKVVYRGYHAGNHLQGMQDDAIKSRTELKLNTEVKEMEQKIADYKLKKEQARSNEKKERETRIHEHKQKLELMKKDFELNLAEMKHVERLKVEEMQKKVALENTIARNVHSAEFLKKLEDLGVDMTKYLVNQQGPVIDQELHVVTATQ